MKVLLKRFHLKDINIGFHPQTQELKTMSHVSTTVTEGINVTLGAFVSYIFMYPFHTREVTAAILASQTNPVGVELFSYVNAFFCRKAACHLSENAL